MSKPNPIKPEAGQESVWDYPRPPRLERTSKEVQVVFNGVVIADSRRAWRVLETSHPPVYYIPPEDINMHYLRETAGGNSWCEWKGQASYYNVVSTGQSAQKAAWGYLQPTPSFVAIKDHLAFYAWGMDQCLVEGELARPQPGNFYGGWITKDIIGPFKGEPGTMGW